ncbi:nucleotidyl transferase AbiEii/AbiGii toxin family protein [uncultured Clostridium sp.]|uniref:nucleotidyl transferase AbiEii/AbiGii toxin family protein n=1 Tax=uncultured Clostridium sp. TaxID=59620 RepID=UPI0026F38182|nr:nucleotidyl transferase AbiEii/AbiGii toxin family protein [uncultured Clostridium sp.]
MSLKEMNIFGNTDKPSLNIKDILKDFLNAIGEDYYNEFVVKGCMALNNHFNYNNLGDARQTRYIDLHYYNREDWENFVKHSSMTSTMNSKLRITYELIWRRGFIKNPNGDSLKFKAVTLSGDIFEFSVDMNFGNVVDLVKLEESKLSFYSIPVILSDKLTVLSTRIVCRRIKDLLDIYLISSNFDLSYIDLCVSIKKRL